ncbi:hypothetical protein GCM10023332_10680 [Luteimonas vadosa]|uniref:General stress protein B n=1 Tax=Luteimonas vadosa TaxID=1165507 RepID=A0ABP9DVX5_9GAMM
MDAHAADARAFQEESGEAVAAGGGLGGGFCGHGSKFATLPRGHRQPIMRASEGIGAAMVEQREMGMRHVQGKPRGQAAQ